MKEQGMHPMMPEANHDELAEQLFVADLKKFIGEEIEPYQRELVHKKLVPDIKLETGAAPRDHVEVRGRLEKEPSYQTWLALTKAAQDMMWESVSTSIERQSNDLNERARLGEPKGSLTLDPGLEIPRYISAQDIHRMPGNYVGGPVGSDVRQGALYDRAGSIYNMGRNGGYMNDIRGHSLISHYFTRFPDGDPERILDMGCTVGNSTVAIAGYFPEAQVHAIDVGEGILRYAHARAEHLGVPIHFSQQNAEHTNFGENSFDLVVSCAMFHETSRKAVPNIISECYRILRPGGVMIHLEVPARYDKLDTWARIRADYEMRFNHEPFWRGALSADYERLSRDAGFEDIRTGFQDATPRATREGGFFGSESKGVHRCWFVVSAVRPES